MHAKRSRESAELPGQQNLHANLPTRFGVVALHLDFVAKPESARQLDFLLGRALQQAGLGEEGLLTALLLVSDREARLVSLLTFWDADRFSEARERRIAWMQKLLLPFADGPVRAQTTMPQFLLAEPSGTLGVDHLSREVRELAHAAG